MNRRRYLATGLAVALAGCMGDTTEEEPDPQDDTDPEDESDDSDETDTQDEPDDEDEPDEEEEPDDEDESDHGLIGTFDDLEDLDLWFEHEDFGSIEADTDRSFEGSQSAVLDPEDDGQVRMRRSLDEPIDVRDVVPGIAMTCETDSRIRIQLQDENGDYAEFSQRVVEDGPLTRHNFGLSRIRGDPDLSEIIVLQVVYWAEDARLWVDDFYFTPRPDEPGKVMLQFYGGHETHYSEGFSTLEEHGLTGTAFVPTNRIGPDAAAAGDYLTEDQVADLADAGWTIGSYSAQGSQLSDDDAPGDGLEDNIAGPIEWLEERGYEDGARCFAYPGSTYNEAAYELVRENYDIAFAGEAPAQGYAGNPHLCSITSSPDPGDGPELLEWTAEYGGITVIPFYLLEEDDAIEALEETAARLADLESEGELEVISPVEMADQYVL
ncbi:polysaccharide deacetylase family protein [Halobacteria archaeon AArc-dxtr1]|nr:polysaccharide deacetylase family protein [Halobacteria archaeon AArc-dxtr1]